MKEFEIIDALIDRLIRYSEGIALPIKIELLSKIADGCIRSIYGYKKNDWGKAAQRKAEQEYMSLAEWFGEDGE